MKNKSISLMVAIAFLFTTLLAPTLGLAAEKSKSEKKEDDGGKAKSGLVVAYDQLIRQLKEAKKDKASESWPGIAIALSRILSIGPTLAVQAQSDSSINLPPVVSGLTAPTVLKVNQVGTWEIKASDPENGSLSYAMDWGEKSQVGKVQSSLQFVQTASFTHAYSSPGTYKVTANVMDNSGKTVKTSATVLVSVDGTVAFEISKLKAKENGRNKAEIKWRTNARADSTVWYGTTTPLNTASAQVVHGDRLSFTHNMKLKGLTPGTTYFVVVGSEDKDGNTVKSAEVSFATKPLPVTNEIPFITEIDGLADVTVGQENTWTIEAVDPENQPLSYSVDWGDTSFLRSLAGPVFFQTAEFSHTYNSPGTYQITFKVRDDKGAQAMGTTSVNVEPAPAPIGPVISGLSATSTASGEATFTWTTNENADTRIWLGTTTPVNISGSPQVMNANLVTSHNMTVTGLAPSTTYFAVVGSVNASGGLSTSSPVTVTTRALPDVTAPIISNVAVLATTTSANIRWTTNEQADSAVHYSTTSPVVVGGPATPVVSNAALSTSHSLDLAGLTASTTYFFVIQSDDEEGNSATTSSGLFFNTTSI